MLINFKLVTFRNKKSRAVRRQEGGHIKKPRGSKGQQVNSQFEGGKGQSDGDQDLSKSCSGHGCINMVRAAKVVTRVKDYGSSQLDLGKVLIFHHI